MKRERFRDSGILALAPKAWGGEFDVLLVGGGEPPPAFERCGAAAVVDVCGPLKQHAPPIPLWDDYDSIKDRVAQALASDARAVILRIDSPGGDAAGCFELSRALRAMALEAKKPLFAFTDAMAASSGYAIACAASRVFVSSTGFVGSVGVIQALADQTRADQAMGLNFAIVASGARKVDGNPHVAISEGAVAEVQAQVDQLASMFFELVAEQRAMSAGAIAALEAGMFFGAKAVASGLADEVTTWTRLLSMVEGSASAPPTEKAKPMSDMQDAVKALRAAAEGEGDDAEKAKKMLAAFEDEGEDGKKKDDDKSKADADGDGDDDEKKKKDEEAAAKAKAEEDEKKKDPAAARASSTSNELALAQRVQALEAERAQEKEAAARAALLATRPDFSAEVAETLRHAPLAVLENACKTWPKTVRNGAAAAAQAQGTRGKGQTAQASEQLVSGDVADHIDIRMGLKAQAGVIENKGRSLELGVMSPEQAAKRLAQNEKGSV